MDTTTRTLVLVWFALMVLLGLTLGASFLPIGALKPVVNISIGFAKAALIYWFFMNLREMSGLIRLVAFAAAVGIVIMLTLVSSDYLSRPWFAAPL